MIPYRFGEDQFPTNEQQFVNDAMQGNIQKKIWLRKS